jgi:hypothetical protein
MADEKEKLEGRDDGAGVKLDRLLAGLDSINSRMDGFEKRLDAAECERADAARKDGARKDAEPGDGKDDPKEKDKTLAEGAKDARKDAEGPDNEREKDEPMPTAADKGGKRKDAARKDAEAAGEKEHEETEAEAARKDAARSAELNELRATIAKQQAALADLTRAMPKPRTDADYHAMAEEQARKDSVYMALGLGPAPIPRSGETVVDYKLRTNTKLKTYSPAWKDANLYAVAADGQALEIADRQIHDHALAAAKAPTDLQHGELREVRRTDETGRIIKEFVGKGTFIGGMKPRSRRVGRFNNATSA